MKNILFTLALLVSFSSFGQISFSPSELGIKDRRYRKIVKKLDLKIINRGFDGKGDFFMTTARGYVNRSKSVAATGLTGGPDSDYIRLWQDVFFEMGIGFGKGPWTLEIGHGGYSGQILLDNTIVLKFTSDKKMYLRYTSSKRKEEFIETAKVVYNEILKSIK
jgi:hypothetical protein